MNLHKFSLIAAILVLSVSVLVGCGNNQAQQSSSKATSSSQTSSQKNSSSSQVSSSSTSSNNIQSSSSSSQSNTAKVDNKTIGVMAGLLVEPNTFKTIVKQQGGYNYFAKINDKDYPNYNGYSGMFANGSVDGLGLMVYKVDGDNITIIHKVYKDPVSSSYMKTTQTTVSQLIKDYYVNQGQKDEVNGYVQKITDK